jgi:uncharacterized protein (TIGR02594 family)
MDAKIYAIQRRLSDLGFSPGPHDGIWGEMTRDAVSAHLGIGRRAVVGSGATDAPWLDMARKELGVEEVPGSGNNPAILGYYRDAGHPEVGSDEVPSCAAFVGAMLSRSGYRPSGSLMARSYLEWGARLDKPRLGCVVVLKRGAPPAGHVGFAVEWNGATVKILGGNQSDAVSVATFSRASIIGYRWPSQTLNAG